MTEILKETVYFHLIKTINHQFYEYTQINTIQPSFCRVRVTQAFVFSVMLFGLCLSFVSFLLAIVLSVFWLDDLCLPLWYLRIPFSNLILTKKKAFFDKNSLSKVDFLYHKIKYCDTEISYLQVSYLKVCRIWHVIVNLVSSNINFVILIRHYIMVETMFKSYCICFKLWYVIYYKLIVFLCSFSVYTKFIV